MQISPLHTPNLNQQLLSPTGETAKGQSLQTLAQAPDELRKTFDSFVGESFYGQLLGAMRKTVGKPAYFHGGHAEEVFRGQLDQTLATKMTESNAGDFTGGMFELFNLNRS